VVPLSRVIVRLTHCQGVSVLVLDTSTLPAEQRREARVTAVSSTEAPQLLDVLAWPAAPSHRLSVSPLLPGVHLIETMGTPVRVARRGCDLRVSGPEPRSRV
jgi:hypothetical protein